MSNTECVCCLCLKNVPSDCSLCDASIAEKLQQLIPELKLSSSTDPICNECTETLEESHKIKRTCSSSNKMINFLKDYLGITDSVDLKELIKGNNKKSDSNLPKSDHVCRICLKGNEGPYVSIADAKTDEFGAILSSCLSTLDESLTTNPLICKICMDSLHKMCTFIKRCTEVENSKPSIDHFPDEQDELFQVVDSVGDDQPDSNVQVKEETSKDVPTEAAENSKCPYNRQRWRTKLQENSEVPYTGPLPRFNFKALLLYGPSGRTVTLDLWLSKVERLAVEMKWSEITIKDKVLERLNHATELRGLFTDAACDSTWAEFKQTLLRTFPSPDDYLMTILDVSRRKKRTSETYVQYYNEKKALLEPLNWSEEQMVSFLIGGILDVPVNCNARMAGYKKLEELLQYLKTCDVNDKSKVPVEGEVKEDQQKQDISAENKNSSLKCVCCDQKGHSSIDCPLIKRNEILKMAVANKTDANKKTITMHENKIVSASTPEKSNKNKGNSNTRERIEVKAVEETSVCKAAQGQKCSCCDKLGHSSMDCPLLRTNQKSNTTEAVILLDDDDITQKAEKHDKDSSGKKCSFCDQIGHSSLVCPLIGIEENSKQMPRRDVIKITFDKDRVDKSHKLPVSSVPELETVKDKNKSSDMKPDAVNTRKKCSCCDKLGHTSLDCPLIRGKQKISSDQTKKDQKIENKLPLKENSQHLSRQNKTELPQPNNKSELPPRKNEPERPTQKNEPQRSSQKNKTERPTQKNEPLRSSQKYESQWTSQNNKTERSPPNNEWQWSSHKDKTERPPQKNESQWSSQKNKTERLPQKNETSQRCGTCRKSGHSSLNCSRSKSSGEKVRMSSDKSRIEDKSRTSKAETSQKCSTCNRYGHSRTNCPLLRTTKTAAEQSLTQPLEYHDEYYSPFEMTKTRKCLCCNKSGHSSLDCPLLGINRNEILTDKYDTYEPQEVAKMDPAQEPCLCCNNPGHKIDYCPFYNFFNRNETEVSNAMRGDQSRNMQEMRNRKSRWTQDKDAPPRKKAKQEDRCYFCNTVGHSSIDCFRSKLGQMQETLRASILSQETTRASIQPQETMRASMQPQETLWAPMQSQETQRGSMQPQRNRHQQWEPEASITDPSVIGMSSQNMQVCELCNRMGHNQSDCFMSRFDRSNFETNYNANSSRQCLYCGKFGHVKSECPRNKPFSKWMN